MVRDRGDPAPGRATLPAPLPGDQVRRQPRLHPDCNQGCDAGGQAEFLLVEQRDRPPSLRHGRRARGSRGRMHRTTGPRPGRWRARGLPWPGHAGRSHDEAQRCFADAFELQVQQLPGRVWLHLPCLPQPLFVCHPSRPLPAAWFGDHDEPPGLAVADRRGHVGGGEHPIQDLGRHLVRSVPAEVPTGADELVEVVPDVLGESPGPHLGGTLGRRGAVTDERHRPLPCHGAGV